MSASLLDNLSGTAGYASVSYQSPGSLETGHPTRSGKIEVYLAHQVTKLHKEKVVVLSVADLPPRIRFRHKARGNGIDGLQGFKLSMAHMSSDDAEV